MRVLVIEDQREVSELVGRALARDGHRVAEVGTLADADREMSRGTFDLAVLDLGLPDGDGLTWCKKIRAEGLNLPILVLSAQSAVAMRVSGLDAGADDFLAKPFAVAELRARVRALGRRGPTLRPNELHTGPVHLDFTARRACVDGVEVPLTNREWSVIELLVARSGAVVTRADILDAVWPDATPTAEASLEVIVARIRKKLGGTFVRTIRGEGYAVG